MNIPRFIGGLLYIHMPIIRAYLLPRVGCNPTDSMRIQNGLMWGWSPPAVISYGYPPKPPLPAFGCFLGADPGCGPSLPHGLFCFWAGFRTLAGPPTYPIVGPKVTMQLHCHFGSREWGRGPESLFFPTLLKLKFGPKTRLRCN